MIDITRRQVLGAVAGASFGVSLAALPHAVATATLDAEVSVLHAARDFTGDIGYVTVAIENTRQPDGEAFVPVPHLWGRGRQTQMAWPPERGAYPSVDPGERVVLDLDAPGEARSVRLQPEEPAMVRVFARGTEQRARDSFMPENYVYTPV